MNILKITESQNAAIFTMFGVVSLITQNLIVGRVTKAFGLQHSFKLGIAFTAVAFFIMFISRSIPLFIFASIILALFNSIVQTLLPTILSQEADAKSQGMIMGLGSSYQSIGMIFGPLLGGLVATIMIPLPFLVGSILIGFCFWLSLQMFHPTIKK